MPQRKRSKLKIDDLLNFWYVHMQKESIPIVIRVFSLRSVTLIHHSLVLMRQVIVNPKLEKKSNRTALFFEGCLRYVNH